MDSSHFGIHLLMQGFQPHVNLTSTTTLLGHNVLRIILDLFKYVPHFILKVEQAKKEMSVIIVVMHHGFCKMIDRLYHLSNHVDDDWY